MCVERDRERSTHIKERHIRTTYSTDTLIYGTNLFVVRVYSFDLQSACGATFVCPVKVGSIVRIHRRESNPLPTSTTGSLEQ